MQAHHVYTLWLEVINKLGVWHLKKGIIKWFGTFPESIKITLKAICIHSGWWSFDIFGLFIYLTFEATTTFLACG